ncbi:DUF4153 domain-containing protein [Pigmentibacter sp. JX0631]|uniref:DUF4153 domain-containing protein n=1 Tax=Pigmentibacter sp. JX0631 TaxID=2976982 RepID=UPI0024692314|nr:DUF4153 domain-containing protein [Pigmentibacter sp. JX0631]WGL58597.1 DUF4153 domain-containing protein [Pigmentibacter sp. JX0631]
MNKIKLFSQNFNQARDSFLRFPSTLLLCFVATALAILLSSKEEQVLELLKFFFSCSVMIPLSIALTLCFESFRVKWGQLYTLAITFGCIILHYLFTVSDVSLSYSYKVIHLFLLFHLMVSFSPFLKKTNDKSFWQFNQILLLKLVEAIFYAAASFIALFIMCSLASYLFDLNLRSEFYLKIFVVCLFIIQTWIFLLGIPNKFNLGDEPYPKRLKLFLQFILIPLILIYIGIIYVYLGKVVVGWNIPKGLTSWFVSGLGIVGVFGYLILNNKIAQIKVKWITFFERYFFYLLIPLIGLLVVALNTRIQDYGITINRYILFVLALWLFSLSLFFILKKNASLKVIPMSLGVTMALAYLGPWGVYQFSFFSQKQIAQKFLKEKNFLNVKLEPQKSEVKLSLEERKEITALFTYLTDYFGDNAVQQILGSAFLQNTELSKNRKFYFLSSSYNYETVNAILDKLGIKHASTWERELNKDNFNLQFNYTDSVKIVAGYDEYFEFDTFHKYVKEVEDYKIKFAEKGYDLLLSKNNELLVTIPLNEKIISLIKQIENNEIVWSEDTILDTEEESILVENKKVKLKMLLSSFSYSKERNNENDDERYDVRGAILIRYKK